MQLFYSSPCTCMSRWMISQVYLYFIPISYLIRWNACTNVYWLFDKYSSAFAMTWTTMVALLYFLKTIIRRLTDSWALLGTLGVRGLFSKLDSSASVAVHIYLPTYLLLCGVECCCVACALPVPSPVVVCLACCCPCIWCKGLQLSVFCLDGMYFRYFLCKMQCVYWRLINQLKGQLYSPNHDFPMAAGVMFIPMMLVLSQSQSQRNCVTSIFII